MMMQSTVCGIYLPDIVFNTTTPAYTVYDSPKALSGNNNNNNLNVTLSTMKDGHVMAFEKNVNNRAEPRGFQFEVKELCTDAPVLVGCVADKLATHIRELKTPLSLTQEERQLLHTHTSTVVSIVLERLNFRLQPLTSSTANAIEFKYYASHIPYTVHVKLDIQQQESVLSYKQYQKKPV
jgi:hypothetical protein